MRKTIRYLLLLYIVLILVVYIFPVNTKGELNRLIILGVRADYLSHALLFIPLPLLCRWSSRTIINSTIGCLIICSTAAVLSECIHLYLPYRTFNSKDMLANFAGIAVGIIPVIMRKDKSQTDA